MIAGVQLPYTYRVSKYDPADRDEHGRYVGRQDERSDHGPVESAYLAVVAAFAEGSRVDRLVVREPELVMVNFGLEPAIEGYGLTGLFAPDLSDYYDGAEVSLEVGLELVRAMLRDNGAWCRLEVDQRFFVHVGFDQYIYLGSAAPASRRSHPPARVGCSPSRSMPRRGRPSPPMTPPVHHVPRTPGGGPRWDPCSSNGVGCCWRRATSPTAHVGTGSPRRTWPRYGPGWPHGPDCWRGRICRPT